MNAIFSDFSPFQTINGDIYSGTHTWSNSRQQIFLGFDKRWQKDGAYPMYGVMGGKPFVQLYGKEKHSVQSALQIEYLGNER